MALITGLDIASSGMSAQRVRLNLVSSNLANAQTTRTEDGGPYRRRDPVFQATRVTVDPAASETERALRSVQVASVATDETLGPLVWDPDHPDADADGNVRMPNVNPAEEMVNLITASRSFEANAQAFMTLRDLIDRVLDLGR